MHYTVLFSSKHQLIEFYHVGSSLFLLTLICNDNELCTRYPVSLLMLINRRDMVYKLYFYVLYQFNDGSILDCLVSTMLSEVQVRPVRPLCQDNPEKWLTKKKVEIVTTKNIEKTIKRQLVLEDGRILDEDIPIVTLDTTENKEVFETDHDEERDNLDYNKMVQMNIGDKVTTLKTTKDVKENVTKTEASQNIGSIANRVTLDYFYSETF